MNSIFLNGETWDLDIDTSNNIAMAFSAYAIAQDVACAVRLFKGEQWYTEEDGVNYFNDILIESASINLFKAEVITAALTVPEVVSAKVFITDISDRKINGQIQITDLTGTTTAIAI